MKFRCVVLVTFALLAVGCSHPLDIIGKGDILSASGDANDPEYNVDLKAIAQTIMDGHDPVYDAH